MMSEIETQYKSSLSHFTLALFHVVFVHKFRAVVSL